MGDRTRMNGEWREYVEPLLELPEEFASFVNDAGDARLRAELHQQLFKMTAVSYLAWFAGDEQHPDFWPNFNQVFSYGAANPDAVYSIASLDSTGVYRISGFRGTVHMVDFQIGAGQFYPRGQGGLAPSITNHDIDTL